jgi:hypothetical protein
MKKKNYAMKILNNFIFCLMDVLCLKRLNEETLMSNGLAIISISLSYHDRSFKNETSEATDQGFPAKGERSLRFIVLSIVCGACVERKFKCKHHDEHVVRKA